MSTPTLVEASVLSPTTGVGLIGASVWRKEDRPLLVGAKGFVDDIHRPGLVHAAIVRSSLAHARITGIDIEAALAEPGVVGIFTSADLPAALPPIPMRMFSQPGMELFLQPPLASDTVRYSGEPVAVVVAESRYLAEDAAELVHVRYEEFEPVLAADRALEPASAVLHPGPGTNLAGRFVVEHGDVEAAFASAAVVVEERLAVQRHAAVPLETRGVICELDELSGVLTVMGAAKIPHVNRRILARLLEWPEERIRLVELGVGGGFGGRGEFYPEDFLVPFCALQLGRPVSWIEDREEHLRSCNHSREQIHEIGLALDADGRFLGLRDRLLNDAGAYVRTHGLVVPGMTAALLPGPYRWPAYRCDVHHVVTTKTPAGTYRAPGRFEANFARERLIDIAAHRVGKDPLELRRRNLVRSDEMPYATGTHTDGHPVVYDSGDYELLLDKGLEHVGWPELRRWRDEDPGPGRRRGVGIGIFVEKSGIAQWEYARVELTSAGKTHVYSGGASVGQGVDTVLAQICADSLGVRYEDVSVFHGDTATVPDGMGAFGSRVTTLGGSAVLKAAAALRERALELAAIELGTPADDLELAGDRVVVRGESGGGIELSRLFELARAGRTAGHGLRPGLSEEAYFRSEDMTFPYGVHYAAVEIDVETGRVDVRRYCVAYDVGRAINPVLVEGQIVGGVAQGIGGALLEELSYSDGGQLVSASFMDYLLPTAAEVPHVDVLVTEDAPTSRNPLGAKGAGEGGTAAVGAALANAVSDALGVEVTRLPLSPDHVVTLAAAGGNR
jgi:aerobic carbon-monoxide dehydrogenase large subunit